MTQFLLPPALNYELSFYLLSANLTEAQIHFLHTWVDKENQKAFWRRLENAQALIYHLLVRGVEKKKKKVQLKDTRGIETRKSMKVIPFSSEMHISNCFAKGSLSIHFCCTIKSFTASRWFQPIVFLPAGIFDSKAGQCSESHHPTTSKERFEFPAGFRVVVLKTENIFCHLFLFVPYPYLSLEALFISLTVFGYE